MKRIFISLITLLAVSVMLYAQPSTTPTQDSAKEDSSIDKEISAGVDSTIIKSLDTVTIGVSENTGTLNIITVPDSAFVIFDEEVKGKSPISIENIPPGKHIIILKKKGHFAKKAKVNVKAGSENDLRFELVKPVKLSVSSEPSGASVLINTKEVGKTPYSDSKLKPGTYDIILTLEGYKKEQHTVSLGSGERDSMYVTLVSISEVPEDTASKKKEKVSEDTSSTKEEKADEKEKSKLSSILDKVALGVFVCFTVIILLIELTQK